VVKPQQVNRKTLLATAVLAGLGHPGERAQS
jgi:hypothetical protein